MINGNDHIQKLNSIGGCTTRETLMVRAITYAVLVAVFAFTTGWSSPLWADVRVDADTANGSDEKWAKDLLLQSQLVTNTATLLDSDFQLKDPLTIYLGGDEGPLFDGESVIELPYAFLVEIRDLFDEVEYAETTEDRDIYILDVVEHTLWHEIGHYLVQSLDLPITGKEEDAVDELAYILLITMYEEGEEIALSAADSYKIIARETKYLEDVDFWDEHSLDQQRFHSGVCLIYGSDPDTYQYLMDDHDIAADRQDMCVDDYIRRLNAWTLFLSKHQTSKSILLR